MKQPPGMIIIIAAAASQQRRSLSLVRAPKNVMQRLWLAVLCPLWILVLQAPTSHSFVLTSPDDSPSFLQQRRSLPKQSSSTTATTTTTTQLSCQLLGMNCANPTSFALSLWPDFCQRGGSTDVHADGWGLAYYDMPGQGGLRQFHDVEAASTSPLASFLGQQPILTKNMLAHIRYATTGEVDLCNVHPFTREYVTAVVYIYIYIICSVCVCACVVLIDCALVPHVFTSS